jgi:hypothetical protein
MSEVKGKMPGGHKRNISGLTEYVHLKKENALKQVDEAIQKLVRNGKPINFNSIAAESGVSKAYLYTNVEIRKRIDGLREQYTKSKKPQKSNMTDKSKDVLLASKNKKIKELEAEVRRLKDELVHLRGLLYQNG